MPQPTIRDVAAAAGVSVATVSRALRGLPTVHPQTRDRVRRAAEGLHYLGSPAAATLASGRTSTIGVVTSFIGRWYFATLLSCIEKTLREHGHHLLLTDLEQADGPRMRLTDTLFVKRVDGLILLNVELDESERRVLDRLSLPVVSVGSRYADRPLIGIDDHECGRLVTEHLVGLGHRRIAFLGAPKTPDAHQVTPGAREAGVRDTLREHGLTLPAELVLSCTWTPGDAMQQSLRLLREHPDVTAVVAGSDEMAYGTLAAARTLGRRVPDDLSVTGMDDHYLAETQGLTTVAQDVSAQGAAAARAMLASLSILDSDLATDRVEPVRLVVRESTGAPRGGT